MKVGLVYKGRDSKFPFIFLGYDGELLVFTNVWGFINRVKKEDDLVETVAMRSKVKTEWVYSELKSHLCDVKIADDGKSAVVVNCITGQEYVNSEARIETRCM